MYANSDDYVGHANLETISENHRFNDWMYNQIKTRLEEKMGNILEVGSGLGTFSEKIFRDMGSSSHLMLTDFSTRYVQSLKTRYSSFQNVSVDRMDLNNREEYSKIGYGKYDSIIALNVLEHVRDDVLALQELYKMLKNGGILIVLVPCHKFLFNVIDEKLGHYRRYTKKELLCKINETNFTVVCMHYFNTAGMVGWFFNGNLLKNAEINRTASRWFDRLVPVLNCLDRITSNITGLSLICCLRRSEPT
jgi:2-polyprenyl-3-methyl-5-hydroxy-6-metoxy-1,4-benzoquinol methylase